MHITHTMYPGVEQESENTQIAGLQLSMHGSKRRQQCTEMVSWGSGVLSLKHVLGCRNTEGHSMMKP